jgi:hypothetical protein
MMMWHLMRNAAVARHYAMWLASGANPVAWRFHMAAITAFYGY